LLETAFYRRLGDITFLPIYTGFSLEAGNAWQQRDEIRSSNLRYAGSIFIGADTFMGPLYFAIGATDRGEAAVYLNIGKTFLDN
jgi:NTE family protein